MPKGQRTQPVLSVQRVLTCVQLEHLLPPPHDAQDPPIRREIHGPQPSLVLPYSVPHVSQVEMGLLSSVLRAGCWTFSVPQKADALTDRVRAWNASGPHDLPTQPLFFIPPSSLGSARRALRWCPYQRSLRMGIVTPQLLSAGS